MSSYSIVFLDENNISIDSLIIAGKHGVDPHQISKVRGEIAEATDRWSEFGAGLQRYDTDTLMAFLPAEQRNRNVPRRGSFRIIKLRYGAIKFRLTLTDKEVLATPVFYLSGRNSHGPALGIRTGFSLYEYLRNELDHLKNINKDYEISSVSFPPIERPA